MAFILSPFFFSLSRRNLYSMTGRPATLSASPLRSSCRRVCSLLARQTRDRQISSGLLRHLLTIIKKGRDAESHLYKSCLIFKYFTRPSFSLSLFFLVFCVLNREIDHWIRDTIEAINLSPYLFNRRVKIDRLGSYYFVI